MFSLLQDQAALSKAWPFPAQKVIPFSLYHACPAVTAVQGFSEHLLPPGMHCQMGTFCTCTFLPLPFCKDQIQAASHWLVLLFKVDKLQCSFSFMSHSAISSTKPQLFALDSLILTCFPPLDRTHTREYISWGSAVLQVISNSIFKLHTTLIWT